MASTISAGTTTSTALNMSGDTSGSLILQTNGTTALTISSAQAATFAGAVGVNGILTAPTVSSSNGVFSTPNGNLGAGDATAYKNKLINGNFDIWQRGTTNTITTSGYTVADRWQYLTDGTLSTGTVFTQQTFTVGQTAVPNNPTYFLQAVYTSVNTPSNYIRQRIENVATLSGQTATFSFWARTTSGTIAISSQFQQEFGTGGSPSSGVYGIGSTSFTATTTWQQFTMTTTISSISGKTVGTNNDSALNAAIVFPSSGSGTIQIAQAQVEVGSSATGFDIRFLGTELAMCQRYYVVLGKDGTTTTWTGACDGTAANASLNFGNLPATMRSVPTITLTSISFFSAATGTTTSTIASNRSSSTTASAWITPGTSITGGQACVCYIATSGTSNVSLSAEL